MHILNFSTFKLQLKLKYHNLIHRAKKANAEYERKIQKVEEDYTQRMEKFNSSRKQTVLNEEDIKLMALNDAKLSRKDVVKMHITNIHQLGLRQRRQVYEKIQNRRSMHARKIFLKELNMVGWQFKNKTANPDPKKASLEQLS